jgi:hypothetical protein
VTIDEHAAKLGRVDRRTIAFGVVSYAFGAAVVACGSTARTSPADASPPTAADSQSAMSDARDSESAISDGGPDRRLSAGSLLVDDQSSSVGEISLPNGGYWYTFPLNSGGTIAPPQRGVFAFTSVDAGGFSRAACVSASAITGYGAGAGFAFQLSMTNGPPPPYDASAYSGVSFYAMSPDAPEMLVTFSDVDTYPFWPGATCAGGADAGPLPDGGYATPPCGHDPEAAVILTPDWQQVNLTFANVSAFKSPAFYSPSSVNTRGLFFMDFVVNNPNFGVDGGAPVSFRFCVAQIYLTQ